MLAETLGLPVSLASHVDAMAGAELLLGMRRFGVPDVAGPAAPASSLYVYARETVGYALVIVGGGYPVTAFGNRVQEAGAGVVSLGGLYADPIGAMRRAAATV